MAVDTMVKSRAVTNRDRDKAASVATIFATLRGGEALAACSVAAGRLGRCCHGKARR